MAVTYSTSLKTDRMNDVIDKIAGKTRAAWTGSALAGTLVIGTSALSGATGVLATFTLDATPGTESGGVLTFTNGGTALSAGNSKSATASATGTAAKAEIRNNGGTVVISGLTVGTSGTDIIINSVDITNGQNVTWTGGTITHG